jgi:hypothetical protein
MREELKDVLGRERDEVMERAWKGFREETGKERSLHAKLGDFNAQLRKEEETFECVAPALSPARYLLSKVWQERRCFNEIILDVLLSVSDPLWLTSAYRTHAVLATSPHSPR